MSNKTEALQDALDFDLFAGDIGDCYDIELSNKIVKGRKEYACFICRGLIAVGEIHRYAAHKFDGEIMTYRSCNACCVAMVSSVNGDFEEESGDDPIDARYALGDVIREASND